MKKLNRKGFTLVELLAVIIILAIVVGITIPAVLTTTSSTKKKAFKTAADTAADWFDRQYQAESTGLADASLATLDSNYQTICVTNSCKIDANGTGNGQDLTANAITAAGLKTQNISTDGSHVWIDTRTGRSCVKLKASSNGDYPAGKVECGGVCTSTQCSSTNN